MNNIYIEKIWSDSDLIEILVIANSEYVTAKQSCYIQKEDLIKNANRLIEYVCENSEEELYLEFGQIKGNFTPAFSMRFIQKDLLGHINIEMDIEIADISDRSHRCKFFVEAELGSIERLCKKLTRLSDEEVGTSCSLYD